MIILGLDASSTAVGYGLIRADASVSSGIHAPKGDVWTRAASVFSWAENLCKTESVTHIILEEPLRSDIRARRIIKGKMTETSGSNYKVYRALYGIAAIINIVAVRCGAQCQEANVQTWRDSFFGSHVKPPERLSSADRTKWWKNKAVEMCIALGYNVKNDDEAEGLCLALMHQRILKYHSIVQVKRK